MTEAAVKPKLASGKNPVYLQDRVFVIPPLAAESAWKIDARYDEIASGRSIYNYFRDYDPNTGRYVQSDPIGLIAGTNTYLYVDGVPVSIVDPLGLESGVFSLGQSPGQLSQAHDILQSTYGEMRSTNVPGTDQFFHCLAACRAEKATGLKDEIRKLLSAKENFRDYPLGRVGLYGDGRVRSHQEMVTDNNADKAANEQGLQCPPGKTCEQNCSSLLDNLPVRRRPFMTRYRRTW